MAHLSLVWVLAHIILILLGFLVSLTEIAPPLWAQGIGSSLIATGVAGVVLFLYISRTETLSTRLSAIQRSGLKDIFPGRSVVIRDKYEERLKSAREIDIMGFGLSSLREDHLYHFVQWSYRANVRIILIDPTYPSSDYSYSSQRDMEEGNPNGRIAGEVRKFIDETKSLPGLNRSRFRIRLMRALPSTNVFRVDDEVFFGPYLMGEQSRNSPTFLVSRGGSLFTSITTHFDRIWSDDRLSIEVPLD